MDNKLQNRKSVQYIYYLLLVVTGIIICFFVGEDGPILMADSEAFLNPGYGVSSSYTLYVSFLMICKKILGNGIYLYGIYVIQGAIAIIVSILLVEYLRKSYKLNYAITYIVYCIAYLPYLYNFPPNVVTHHIMTEALAIPVMILFFLCLLRYINEQKIGYMVGAMGMGVLLMKTRSQFRYILFIVLFIIVIQFMRRRMKALSKKQRTIFSSVFVVGIVIVLYVAITIIPIMVRNNIWQQFTDAVLGRTLCTIDIEDRELFYEPEQLGAFDFVYDKIDASKQRVPYFRNNTWRSNDIAYATNENTKHYYGWIEEYYSKYHSEIAVDELSNRVTNTSLTIISELLRDNMSDYIVMTLQLIPSSLVSSVFVQPDIIHGLCYFITFIIFLVTLLAIIYYHKRAIEMRYIVPMLLTLLILLTNVVVVNVLFYGQQRYVIYTYGLFYVSWIIMLKGIKNNRK